MLDYAAVIHGRRAFLVFLALATSCTGTPLASQENASPPTPKAVTSPASVGEDSALARLACSSPRQELIRTWNGTYPGRSGDILFYPKEPSVLGSWFPHSGPWGYLQRVPMLWYGPGHVPSGVTVNRPVTMADVAPTIAELLGYPFEAPDGTAMGEALLPESERPEPPRLILVVVWDGGGRNVMREHPDAWPTVRRLIRQGTWFDQATVGSSPSVTPSVHTTLGTGVFPRRHGVADLRFRLGDGLIRPEYRWPGVLLTPALADLYDRDMGNEAEVGVVAAIPWHLGMIGQGAALDGGDRDVAVLCNMGRCRGAGRLYQFPRYVQRIKTPETSSARFDRQDGRIDGMWFGHDVLPKLSMVALHTRVLETVIRREGYGTDDTPDLLFTNYKHIDAVGHAQGLNSPEMDAVMFASDRGLARILRVLDEVVGKGRWVMMLTADHGTTPRAESVGGVTIDVPVFAADLNARFDDDGDDRKLILAPRPTQLWVDHEELRENGVTLADIATFITRYTRGQFVSDPGSLSPQERRQRLFSLAVPARTLERLPCIAGS